MYQLSTTKASPEPGLPLLEDLAVDLLGDLGPDGPPARRGRRRWSPPGCRRGRWSSSRRPCRRIFSSLKTSRLKRSTNAVVVVEEDGGVEDAGQPARRPGSGAAILMTRARSSTADDRAPGVGRRDDRDERPLGQIAALRAGCSRRRGRPSRRPGPAVRRTSWMVPVVGHAVAVGVEVVGPDEDRPVRVDDVDDVERELRLDLDELVEQEASGRRPAAARTISGRLGQVLDDPRAASCDLLLVELVGGGQAASGRSRRPRG